MNWKEAGVKTVKEAEEHEKAFKEEKKAQREQKSQGSANYRKPSGNKKKGGYHQIKEKIDTRNSF